MSDLGDLFEGSSQSPAPDLGDSSLQEGPYAASARGRLPGALRKTKFPPATKKLFFPIIPDAGGRNCLALAAAGIPASFFKTLPLDALRVPAEDVVRTSHENLVNLQELYVGPSSVILTYDSWGISLQEICRISNVFSCNESAVATICKEILKGLKYIHEEVGIAHGNLSCSTVIITEQGRVKIADIGDSMMQDHGLKGREQDCLAVSQIARFLLQLDTAVKFSTAVRLEAEDFVNQPLGSTIGELLRHPFLRKGTETRSLQPFQILLRILHPSA